LFIAGLVSEFVSRVRRGSWVFICSSLGEALGGPEARVASWVGESRVKRSGGIRVIR
jgi:hypothetical protein